MLLLAGREKKKYKLTQNPPKRTTQAKENGQTNKSRCDSNKRTS
jgi:hypothetical protein